MFLIHRFGFNEARIGNFFAWVGLCAIFTQLVTTRRVAARFSEAQVLKVTLLGVSAVMIGVSAGAVAACGCFAIAPLSSTFNGLSLANMGGLLSRSVPPQVQGEILGHRVEHPGAGERAAAAARRVRRGVARARSARAGGGADDVRGVG